MCSVCMTSLYFVLNFYPEVKVSASTYPHCSFWDKVSDGQPRISQLSASASYNYKHEVPSLAKLKKNKITKTKAKNLAI